MRLYHVLQIARAVLVVATFFAGVNLVFLLGGGGATGAPLSANSGGSVERPTRTYAHTIATAENAATSTAKTAAPVPTATTTLETSSDSSAPTTPPPAPEPAAPEPAQAKTLEPATRDPLPIPKTFLSLVDINPKARTAVVNILCTTEGSGAFHPISGSGIVIDPRGVILTNAHVAQYFLLNDEINCIVRTGSPARAAYTAELLFLPPAWIEANAHKITSRAPLGTGEHDYALLRIAGRVGGGAPPTSFEYMAPKIKDDLDLENQMLVVAYPSELVGAVTTQLNLYQVSTTAAITRAFYFNDADGDSKTDLYSLGGSIVAQGGSSGGAVVDLEDGALIGVVVTSTQADTTAEKDLRSVSVSHINRSLTAHTGLSLGAFLDNDPEEVAAWFRRALLDDMRKKLRAALEPQSP